MIPWCQRGTVLLRIDGHISESTDLRNLTRTAQKMNFYIRISSVNVTKFSFQRIWSHLVKKYLIEDFIFFVQRRTSKGIKRMPNTNQKSKLFFFNWDSLQSPAEEPLKNK